MFGGDHAAGTGAVSLRFRGLERSRSIPWTWSREEMRKTAPPALAQNDGLANYGPFASSARKSKPFLLCFASLPDTGYDGRVIDVRQAWTGLHGRAVLLISLPPPGVGACEPFAPAAMVRTLCR